MAFDEVVLDDDLSRRAEAEVSSSNRVALLDDSDNKPKSSRNLGEADRLLIPLEEHRGGDIMTVEGR